MPVWVECPEALAVLRAAISKPKQVDALATFVRDMVRMALHSALVAIDGGASSAEIGRVRLVDKRGVSLGEGLHELYLDHFRHSGHEFMNGEIVAMAGGGAPSIR